MDEHGPFVLGVAVVAALCVLGGLVWAVRAMQRGLRRSARERGLGRQVQEWSAIAESLGSRARIEGDSVVIRGVIAARPFELHSRNCITYGMDAENGIQVPIEDEEASLAIAWLSFDGAGHGYGRSQAPTGDAEFDGLFRVWANPRGSEHLARLGPSERRLLLDNRSELYVFLRKGQALVRLPYKLERSHVEAAIRLLAALWPARA